MAPLSGGARRSAAPPCPRPAAAAAEMNSHTKRGGDFVGQVCPTKSTFCMAGRPRCRARCSWACRVPVRRALRSPCPARPSPLRGGWRARARSRPALGDRRGCSAACGRRWHSAPVLSRPRQARLRRGLDMPAASCKMKARANRPGALRPINSMGGAKNVRRSQDT